MCSTVTGSCLPPASGLAALDWGFRSHAESLLRTVGGCGPRARLARGARSRSRSPLQVPDELPDRRPKTHEKTRDPRENERGEPTFGSPLPLSTQALLRSMVLSLGS